MHVPICLGIHYRFNLCNTMIVHHISPAAPDKNLGRAYNEAMSRLPDGDWACITDLDTMFLTPNAIPIIHQHAEMYEDLVLSQGMKYGCLTCYTNRIHPAAKMQLLSSVVSHDRDIGNHIILAQEVEKRESTITVIHDNISGFLMLISKSLWNEVKFVEGEAKCLGVDTEFSKTLREQGRPIARMNNLYVFHLYRMGMPGGIKDKSHLQ